MWLKLPFKQRSPNSLNRNEKRSRSPAYHFRISGSPMRWYGLARAPPQYKTGSAPLARARRYQNTIQTNDWPWKSSASRQNLETCTRCWIRRRQLKLFIRRGRSSRFLGFGLIWFLSWWISKVMWKVCPTASCTPLLPPPDSWFCSLNASAENVPHHTTWRDHACSPSPKTTIQSLLDNSASCRSPRRSRLHATATCLLP